jgi:hypothetical protein
MNLTGELQIESAVFDDESEALKMSEGEAD